jgi:hypothetical protein
MKKLFFMAMLALLCVSIAYADQMQMNYSVEIRTHQTSTNGSFELFVDSQKWGAETPCDGRTFSAPVQVVKNFDCGAIQSGNVNTLQGNMQIFIDKFNDTRVYCLQSYSDCQRSLTECQINKQHKDELLDNCNGTNSDWYNLYQKSQQSFEACSSKTCYDDAYITQLKDDAKNQRWMDIGMTAAVVSAIAYALYFKKGMAYNPYEKV